MSEDYSYLRDEYPPVITLDQLYRICHISKRKGKWLLENGVIPCKDSGKKTRRFQVKLTDVILFLQERDAGHMQSKIPAGIFSSCSSAKKHAPAPMDAEEISDLLRLKWGGEPDVLTTREVAEMLSCSPATVIKWAAQGVLPATDYRGRLLIAKEHLIAYVAEQAVRQSPKLSDLVMRYRSDESNNPSEMGQKFGW